MATCCERCNWNDWEEKVMKVNDDTVLDAQDMAAEIAVARGESCAVHEGAKLPCPFDHDDAVLDDVDAVLADLQKKTPVSTTEDTFERVLNQWLDACIKETKEAPNVAATLAIFRLGTLGQRLLYEANHLGMREVMTATKDVLNPVHDKEPSL